GRFVFSYRVETLQGTVFARVVVEEALALAALIVGAVGILEFGRDRQAMRQLSDDPLAVLDARDRLVDRRDTALVIGSRLRNLRRFFDLVDFHRRVPFWCLSQPRMQYMINSHICQ